MGKKKNLADVLQDHNWEEDSKKEHWDNFYIPFYFPIWKKTICFDELTYIPGKPWWRVVAKTNTHSTIGKRTFGGDVIINLDNIPKEYMKHLDLIYKYDYANLGLLPKEGNLQGAKKKAGNDWQIDKFLKLVHAYYCNKSSHLLYLAKNRNNQKLTENTLHLLSCQITPDGLKETNCDSEKIYTFCENVYGINCRVLINKLLDCNEETTIEEYCNLLNTFWAFRKKIYTSRINKETTYVTSSAIL